jgi:GNAT superfamily N-acetyltransferase
VSEPVPKLPLEVTLDDGTRLRLRLGTPADREALAAGFERLSPTSRLHRFFSAMPRLAPHFLDRLVDLDPERHVAIAALDLGRDAEVGDPAEGLGVGVARYLVDEQDPTRAEAAVAVADDYQGRGIGRLLLEALAVHAAARGIAAFTAHVRADNEAMRTLLVEMGARGLRADPEERSVLRLEVPVTGQDASRSHLVALLRRAAEAEAEADAGMGGP